jgi:localization factor PodJL
LHRCLAAHHHSSTLRQLDAAIAALRAIVSIVASADALARLSAEVRLLSPTVERA